MKIETQMIKDCIKASNKITKFLFQVENNSLFFVASDNKFFFKKLIGNFEHENKIFFVDQIPLKRVVNVIQSNYFEFSIVDHSIQFSTENQSVKVEYYSNTFQPYTMYDFSDKEHSTFKIDSELLYVALDRVVKASGRDITRVSMHGMLVDNIENGLTAIATDSRRLCIKNFDTIPDNFQAFCMPKKFEFIQYLNNECTVKVFEKDWVGHVSITDNQGSCFQHEFGIYPNVKQLLYKHPTYFTFTPNKETVKTIKKCLKDSQCVWLKLENGKASIKYVLDNGEMNLPFEITYTNFNETREFKIKTDIFLDMFDGGQTSYSMDFDSENNKQPLVVKATNYQYIFMEMVR